VPQFAHDRATRLGVLLLNLGTPDAPTTAAVRRYLAEFLADPRVVEIPRVLWLPLLHGVILRVRPARSAARYAAIWTKDGSPLLVHSQRQKTLLLGYLGQRLKTLGLPSDYARVELGMRYGTPSIEQAIDALHDEGCDRILVLPLYPQYAASTTASALDAVFAATRRLRRVPALRTVDAYHDDPGYIEALARSINDYWVKNGRPDKLVLSFHGVVAAQLSDLGDPYHCHARRPRGCWRPSWAQTRAISRHVPVAFRPRRMAPTLYAAGARRLARTRRRCRLPGFRQRRLRRWRKSGSRPGRRSPRGCREFHVVPCLNEHPAWIAALANLAMRNLDGWPDLSRRGGARADADAREGARRRALIILAAGIIAARRVRLSCPGGLKRRNAPIVRPYW
jgi:ferrochelatase